MHAAWRRIRLEEVAYPPLRELLDRLLQFDAEARPTWREASSLLRGLAAQVGGQPLSARCAGRRWTDEPSSVGQRTLREVKPT